MASNGKRSSAHGALATSAKRQKGKEKEEPSYTNEYLSKNRTIQEGDGPVINATHTDSYVDVYVFRLGRTFYGDDLAKLCLVLNAEANLEMEFPRRYNFLPGKTPQKGIVVERLLDLSDDVRISGVRFHYFKNGSDMFSAFHDRDWEFNSKPMDACEDSETLQYLMTSNGCTIILNRTGYKNSETGYPVDDDDSWVEQFLAITFDNGNWMSWERDLVLAAFKRLGMKLVMVAAQ